MKKKQFISSVLCSFFAVSLVTPIMAKTNDNQVKNIIYMIPDGGGMTPYYLSDAVKQAGGWDRSVYPNSTISSEGEMYSKQYLVGGVTTYSANASVTDSAAAGTALSSGYKTKNEYIGVNPDKIPHANILEAAQFVGKNVGMVSTYEWSHATPAAFSAHDKARGNYVVISEQVVNQGIDVVLGGGFGAAQWGSIEDAEIRGYDIIDTVEELENVQPGDKIWGNLVPGAFSYDIELPENSPTISDMTKAAITALNDDNENGFFLMVEGSKVDGGGHSNYAAGMVSEFLAFDEACRVALEFAEGRDDTIVIIVPDHDTGGMNIPSDLTEVVNSLKKGEESDEIVWETTGHTARNGGLFMYVPEGVDYPDGISGKDIGTHKAYENNVVDNTIIAQYLAKIIGINLDELSNELFVDVTDKGIYNEKSEMFRFNDYPITVKKNASYAYVDDSVISLDGQVALHINDKFYVPQLLIDIIDEKVVGEQIDYIYPVSSYLDIYMPDSTDITKWNCRVYITNLLPNKEVSGKIKFTMPENFADMDDISIESIASDEQKIVEFSCPDIDIENMNFNYAYEIITDDGKVSSFKGSARGLAYAGYVTDQITIDGIIDEDAWSDSIQMTCDKASQIRQIEDWKGPRDLSATFSILWDEEYFYMYAVVTDEIFYPETEASSLWKGDSVQFGVFNDVDGVLARGQAGSDFEEIGIALIDDEPVAYRFKSQNGDTQIGIIEKGENFDMACVRKGDDLTYELKFKWNDLFGYDYKPEFGSVLGFSALINDNDGGGRKGWIEYGSGIGEKKNVNLFVNMPMIDFSGITNNEIKIIFNGKKLNPDTAPVIVDDRTLLPVRVIFEELGAEVIWDDDNKEVISSLEGSTVRLKIGEKLISVNGQDKEIDVAAQIINDRTFVPVRAISEAYNCEVNWKAETRTVQIISNN